MTKAKALFCMVLCLCLVTLTAPLAAAAAAESGSCGENVTWQLDETGTLTISGSGDMQDYESREAPWYNGNWRIGSLVIGEGVTSIGSYAFEDCKNLIGAVLPGTLKKIGEYAFWNCAFTEIVFPEGVETIESGAISLCMNLRKVTIPKTAVNIDEGLIGNTPMLENIVIHEENPTLAAIDGMLLTKDKSTLLRCCPKRPNPDCVIPLGVKKINEFAFLTCSYLTSLTIPEGVETIEDFAFEYCTSLKTVKFPKSIKKIGGCAFRVCESLENVYYAGSEEDWNNAKIEKNWAHLAGEYTLHFDSINCDTQLILTVGEKTASVNGAPVENDVAPQIVNGRTMLPVRFLAERLGAQVCWDGQTGTVTILEPTAQKTIVLKIGSAEAVVNNQSVTLDAPAFVQDGRTFLPVRFITEELGCYVKWMENTQQVLIEKY